ncbi:MAG: dTMP kinase [Candidatus Micrarchaeota archaeon]
MFIVFEGLDGCGKETQITLLKQKLASAQCAQNEIFSNIYSAINYFKYPTRNFGVLNDFLERKIHLSSKSLFLLFLADIANEQEKIKQSELAISDRYVFSTIAYEVDGINYNNGKKITEASGFIKPDLVVYLDIDADISQERKSKQKQLDRYEENKIYLAQVRENYLNLYQDKFLTDNWCLVDASKNISEVHLQILNYLKKFDILLP